MLSFSSYPSCDNLLVHLYEIFINIILKKLQAVLEHSFFINKNLQKKSEGYFTFSKLAPRAINFLSISEYPLSI